MELLLRHIRSLISEHEQRLRYTGELFTLINEEHHSPASVLSAYLNVLAARNDEPPWNHSFSDDEALAIMTQMEVSTEAALGDLLFLEAVATSK